MWPPQKILCPTDFSEGSGLAISQAAELAKHVGASVSLLHVIPSHASLPSDPGHTFDLKEASAILREQAEKNLRQSTREIEDAGVRVNAILVVGDAATAILEAAASEQADLIVLSTYGKTGWRRLAYGSVTEKVVRLAACPVLTIRRAQPEG